MAVARVPIFYTRVGRVIRLGFCVSWCKLVNVSKLSCYDVFYYLQSGKPNFVNARCIFANFFIELAFLHVVVEKGWIAVGLLTISFVDKCGVIY